MTPTVHDLAPGPHKLRLGTRDVTITQSARDRLLASVASPARRPRPEAMSFRRVGESRLACLLRLRDAGFYDCMHLGEGVHVFAGAVPDLLPLWK